jgi:hypothetical protein
MSGLDLRGAVALAVLAVLAPACGESAGPADASSAAASPPATRRIPLTDLGQQTYLGFSGGLYPGGSNDAPSDHASAGRLRAVAIEPLDVAGRPSRRGRYVLLSIGMSNTTQEFCSESSAPPCDSWTFAGQAAADPAVNRTTLAIVNGAAGGKSAGFWDAPGRADYDRIRDTRLSPAGLSEQQVQIAWVKVANPGPTVSLPAGVADAYTLVTQSGNIVRALKVRYPNLQQVFLSSRIYAGYATTTLNPEPYAYESGFAVKWLVEAQIQQRRTGRIDARAGDLGDAVAPWIGWGPYLWADGTNPRSDGLVWERADLAGDGTHPSRSGQAKVGTLLLRFFKESPWTRCWFLAGETCP